MGDGKFLGHWGDQTLDQAIRLDTPRLIGESHKLMVGSGFTKYEKVEVEDREGEMLTITRSDDKDNFVCFIPEVAHISKLPKGKIFLPLKGVFSRASPDKGQVVVIS